MRVKIFHKPNQIKEGNTEEKTSKKSYYLTSLQIPTLVFKLVFKDCEKIKVSIGLFIQTTKILYNNVLENLHSENAFLINLNGTILQISRIATIVHN